MRNRPQISLITQKIAFPKAVTCLYIPPIDLSKAGQPNPPQFLREGMRCSVRFLRGTPGQKREIDLKYRSLLKKTHFQERKLVSRHIRLDFLKLVSLIHHSSYVKAWDVAVRFFWGTSWTKTTNWPQISLITPKITNPKAFAYFYIHYIRMNEAGQSNSIYFVWYKLLLHCDDLLLVACTY